MKITNFFQDDFTSYALYDAYRSIASCVDGLKNSARKVVYTVDKNNIKQPIKVASLASKTVDYTQYLHGQVSLEGVIVGLAQDFSGANNINILKPEGSFGNRTIQDPAASRYIYTCQNENFRKLFNDEDNAILISQEFEGDIIEPRFYVPVLPLILVNGSEGVGTGFAQKILPRNPKDIIKSIDTLQKGGKIKKLVPWFKNFKGKVEWNEEKENWKIYGCFDKLNQTTLAVTELPVGYDLEKYLNILRKLEDDKVISDYTDKSEDNKFFFEVKVSREFLNKDEEWIYEKLKLIKQVSENFTCIDENNSVIEFSNDVDLLQYYFKIRMDFYLKRKEYMLDILQKKTNELLNKFKFIYLINKGDIIINKKTKLEIEKQCEKNGLEKKDDSYQYLIAMPIYSLTKEKMQELKESIECFKNDITVLKNKTLEVLWQEDIKNLK